MWRIGPRFAVLIVYSYLWNYSTRCGCAQVLSFMLCLSHEIWLNMFLTRWNITHSQHQKRGRKRKRHADKIKNRIEDWLIKDQKLLGVRLRKSALASLQAHPVQQNCDKLWKPRSKKRNQVTKDYLQPRNQRTRRQKQKKTKKEKKKKRKKKAKNESQNERIPPQVPLTRQGWDNSYGDFPNWHAHLNVRL